jgi:hypothetical protein
VNCSARGTHAKSQPVSSKKDNSKAKAEVGSQAGGEIEATEGCDEKGGSHKGTTDCRHPDVANYGEMNHGQIDYVGLVTTAK